MKRETPQTISHVCFIGAGYVGGPTAAVLAKENPNVKVTVVDRNVERIGAWRTGRLPVSEPGLLDIVKIARDGLGRQDGHKNLFFTTEIEKGIQQAQLLMMSVDTPTKSIGTGSGYCLDTTSLEDVALSIAEFAQSDKIVVEKSTVPVGTGDAIRKILNDNARDHVRFDVLSNPEFLAEGTAIQNLLFPDRILIGSLQTSSGIKAAEALANLYAAWVPRSRIITTNLWSSELSKLAANALLAQRVSSVNALSALCEATGAEIEEVSKAVGSDTRIGPHMLRASFGFGGSCFQKDIRSLVYLSRSLHLDKIASYWEAILEVNEVQKARNMNRIVSRFHDNLRRRRIAVLGFAFKKDTGDTRESCAIDLVRGFLSEGATVNVYDPCVSGEQIRQDVEGKDSFPITPGKLKICSSGEQACQGAHAVLIATDWDMFRVQPDMCPSHSQRPFRQRADSAMEDDIAAGSEFMKIVKERFTFTATYQQEYHNNYAPKHERLDRSTSGKPQLSPQTNGEELDGLVHNKPLDWCCLSEIMVYPKIVLGSSQCLNQEILEGMGFSVEIIGKKSKE